MVTMPTIDTIRTGHRIEKLRILSGLSVKQLQKNTWSWNTTGNI